MKRAGVTLIVFILILLLFPSCGNSRESNPPVSAPPYHTWLSLGEMDYGNPETPPPLELPPKDAFPWAGIASHHVLAHSYLDAWFAQLAKMRQIKTFYIVSPSHYGISVETYSLTDRAWDAGSGLVESDTAKVHSLAEKLKVELEPGIFRIEHGVSTFMPYINKYFPNANVVAIALEGEPPVNIPAARALAEALESRFDRKGKKDNFLLISSDFSHHHGIIETAKRDALSEAYFRNPANRSWNQVGCDNRPGIYSLHYLGKNNPRASIMYHTNSWEISGQDGDDITSYFFVYFLDGKR